MQSNNKIDYKVNKFQHKDGISFIISDSKRAAQKSKLLAKFPNAKTASPRKEGFLYVQDVQDQINVRKENWVILDQPDIPGIKNAIKTSFSMLC